MLEEEYQQELKILRSAQGRVPARQEDVYGQSAGYVTRVTCSTGALYISYLPFWFQPLSEVTFLGAEIFRHELFILFAAIVTCGYKYLIVTRLTVNNVLKLRVKNSLSEGKLNNICWIWFASDPDWFRAVARSRPSDSCTPACFRTGSVWPKPDSQPEPNWIQGGFA